jgi:chorismate synthase
MADKLKAPFRYDIVGSFLRPQAIHEARAKWHAGEITFEQLREVEDVEVAKIIEKQKAVGLHAVTDGEFRRTSNNAGGLEGGMTTGMPLVITAAMKPIPTLMTPLETVNLDTLCVEEASKERSDVCAVPAAAVVAEGEVAFALANAYLEAFGDTCMADIKANIKAYKARLRTMGR